MSRTFFEERTDQSEVKARIVQKYFYAWAKVIMPTVKSQGEKLAYIDMYAGPGRYKDGAKSTPLLVLENAIADDDMRERLVVLLNDADSNHASTLEAEIEALPGYKRLKNEPQVSCGSVGDDSAEMFQTTKMMPSFTFFDPFGYVGLSLKIVQGVIKDWGCDCVFFFNYNRINAGISNPAVDRHMRALFGDERAIRLQSRVVGKTPHQRQNLILEELAEALKEMGAKFVLPFIFKNEKGTRTSHSLIFVTKHFKGYEIMKEVMAKESSVADEGVYTFSYSPAEAETPLLFSLARPFTALKSSLLKTFAGLTLSMRQIYEKHSVDTPYIKKNYKDALSVLEKELKITAMPSERRANTFADHVMVTFPTEKKNGK